MQLPSRDRRFAHSQHRRRLHVEALESRSLPALLASLVADINPGIAASGATPLGDLNNTLLLSVDDGVSGRELWRSDGTATGTVRIKDINPGLGNSTPSSTLAVVAGTGFFVANDGVHGRELWRTDGTEAGTSMVADIKPGASSSSPTGMEIAPGQGSVMTVLGNVLLFSADDGIHGVELWRSDGTAAGTWMVADINPNGSSFANGVARLGSSLYFAANDGVHGAELWKSDGTSAGTALAVDVNPGPSSGGSQNITSLGEVLLFTGTDAVAGSVLWRSDGTTAGTSMLWSNPNTVGLPRPSRAAGPGGADFVLFVDPTRINGIDTFRLWKSDGTLGGTVQPDSNLVWRNASVFRSIPVGATYYFYASESGGNYDLWKSDGTAQGTLRLSSDILLGDLRNAGGRLMFSAYNEAAGYEPWTSNGLPNGTSLVQDINAGPLYSDPGGFINIGGVIYFGAREGVHGGELWRIDDDGGAPTVTHTEPNAGDSQRSQVTGLRVTFDAQVDFPNSAASAFSLRGANGAAVRFDASSSIVNGVTVITLNNFTGSETEFGSLRDGRYTLTGFASQVFLNGQQMTADYTLDFHRYYGDMNGDRRVDISDFGFFSLAYLTQANYNAALDFNNDGRIDIADFGQFSARFFTTLP